MVTGRLRSPGRVERVPLSRVGVGSPSPPLLSPNLNHRPLIDGREDTTSSRSAEKLPSRDQQGMHDRVDPFPYGVAAIATVLRASALGARMSRMLVSLLTLAPSRMSCLNLQYCLHGFA